MRHPGSGRIAGNVQALGECGSLYRLNARDSFGAYLDGSS